MEKLNVDNPLHHHYFELMEKEPLLRAAAESLYERKGNPYSNPAEEAGVINTKHWRHHEAVDFRSEALSTLVNAMVGQDYALANSPYATRRSFGPGLKLLAEEKVMFHRLLDKSLNNDLLPYAQEIVLLYEYQQALKAQPNDLSPTLAERKAEVAEALNSRCQVLAAAIGPEVERCNVRAFPTPDGKGR